METTVSEIAPDLYRLNTYVPDADFQFNQYLVLGDEPLLFHTGPRGLFPLVAEAMERVSPVADLRWITFGHVEADECGAMNAWLAAAPRAAIRGLADLEPDLEPRTLALMHGPAFTGDCGSALRDLAEVYAERLARARQAGG